MNKADKKRPEVLVIGDIMLDKYLQAREMRRSPEADIPLVYNYNLEDRIGGAGNVASNLVTMGVSASLIGVVGNDEGGEKLREMCTWSGVNSILITDPNRITTVKMRVVDGDYRQLLRIDKEDTEDINPAIAENIIREMRHFTIEGGLDAIILQDYNKGIFTPDTIRQVLQEANRAGIPVLADPKEKHFNLLAESDVFKPNLKELSLALGRKIPAEKKHIDSAVTELGLLEHGKIFVTLADRGIYFAEREHSGIVPGITVDNADVSGAGDTVMAALTTALIKGYNISDMAMLANRAGARVCEKKGVSTVKWADISS